MDLVMSLEFTRKQEFKLKKMKRPIYARNINDIFNKEKLIKHTVKVNIFYKEDRKRIEINMIREQKWNIILNMLWLAQCNSKIDWKTGEVKIIRYLEKCKRQWRPVQKKHTKEERDKGKARKRKERGKTAEEEKKEKRQSSKRRKERRKQQKQKIRKIIEIK